MAGGGGGDVLPNSPRAQLPRRRRRRGGGRRRRQAQAAAWLPLDVVVEIATRSDAATLVRCAATCREARRRIAEDPDLCGRLRLRDAGRFLLPLLRGHLMGIKTYHGDGDRQTDVYLVDIDTTAATCTFAEVAGTGALRQDLVVPMDSRGGLILVRARATAHPWHRPLLVCNLATRRRLTLPLEPAFPDVGVNTDVQYVLLVGDGDGEAGRPFLVLKAKLVLSKEQNRRLLVQTYSSELGAWSPRTEIPTPNLDGSDSWPPPLQRRPVVVGYVLTLHLHARAVAWVDVTVTALPASFPRDRERRRYEERHRYLLATASAGGDPDLVVLVADTDKVSAWEQQSSAAAAPAARTTKTWKLRPRVVIKNDALAELVDKEWRWRKGKHVPELVWFGEKSGAVLLRVCGRCLFWLDLHSNKIVRFSSLDLRKVYCPYEVDSSSWVPTFGKAGTI